MDPGQAPRWRLPGGGSEQMAGRAEPTIPLIPSGQWGRAEPSWAMAGTRAHGRLLHSLLCQVGRRGPWGLGGAGPGWGCQARLRGSSGLVGSLLTMHPLAVLQLWLQLLPWASRVHGHPDPLHAPACPGLRRVLPHAVPHRGPCRQGEGGGRSWDTQGAGSAGVPGVPGVLGCQKSQGYLGVPGALWVPDLPGEPGVLGCWGYWE